MRYSLGTLVLAVLFVGSLMGLWMLRDPWVEVADTPANRHDEVLARSDSPDGRRWLEWGLSSFNALEIRENWLWLPAGAEKAGPLWRNAKYIYDGPVGFRGEDVIICWNCQLRDNSGASKRVVFHRRFPEWWWGHFYRPEVWLTVLLGTLYPLFLDALDLGKISVGPPYFDTVFLPLMTPAIFLMGIGPLAQWKQASLPALAIRLRWAFGVSLVTAVAVPWLMGQWTPLISLGLLLAFWVLATIVVDLRERLVQAEGGSIGGRMAALPRAYWGMVLAHCGVALFIVGVTMVKGFEVEQDVRMNVGETATLGGYTFRFDGTQQVNGPNYVAARGTIQVSQDGREVTVMYPEKRRYFAQNQTMTEAAISPGLLRDLYVSLGEPLEGGAWSVRLYHKPFIDWIWGGCLVMALGGVLAVSDRRYRLAWRRKEATVPATAQMARPTVS